MKNIIALFLTLSLTVGGAMAADLDDVVLLDYNKHETGTKLKLRSQSGPADSYFFVDVVDSDPQAQQKLDFVNKKIDKREKFELNLSIKSFSVKPSGSYYRSDSVNFDGADK